MNQQRETERNQWVIATFNQPVILQRNEDEAYPLNPMRRYVFNTDDLDPVREFVQTLSELKGSRYYTPLSLNASLHDAHILIERNRKRGIGDLLFMTGPMEYIRHLTAGAARQDMYGMSDRGIILQNHEALRFKTVLCGPVHYDDLGLYNYHWMVETVTETSEEIDQLNVYDALYKQLGVDPAVVPAKFKRPTMYLTEKDNQHLDHYYRAIWENTQLDLRKTPYYVVAPFSAATLRTMPYGTWLEIIGELAKRRPVVVVGKLSDRMPSADMTAGEFCERLLHIPNTVAAMGVTGLRVLMALISKAACFFGMDSGPLYIAQAARVPAISVWGSHDPGVRLGYDADYMELAVWNSPMCHHAPCYAYACFPEHKCPRGSSQQICEVLLTVNIDDIMDRLDKVENKQIERYHAIKQAT